MNNELVACPRCDALFPVPPLGVKQVAVCSRCGCKVSEIKKNSIDRTIAISMTGLVLFIPGVSMPMVGATLVGQYAQVSLLDCLMMLLQKGFFIVALGLFLFTMAIPLIRLATAFYICWSVKHDRIKPSHRQFFRSYHFLNSWAMLHVFFLGISVALYKLAEYAEISLNIGIGMFAGLLLCTIFIHLTLDSHYVWQQLEKAEHG